MFDSVLSTHLIFLVYQNILFFLLLYNNVRCCTIWNFQTQFAHKGISPPYFILSPYFDNLL